MGVLIAYISISSDGQYKSFPAVEVQQTITLQPRGQHVNKSDEPVQDTQGEPVRKHSDQTIHLLETTLVPLLHRSKTAVRAPAQKEINLGQLQPFYRLVLLSWEPS